ncbi:MAG: polyphenol oxidase [Phenylobacterium zucineum]|nr:MAG: polyphenol oxidase [Phenylobacterium zucineum]
MLPVLTSPLLDLPGIRHAFFTHQGGVSQGIYAGLNVGQGSGDALENVMENRRLAAAHFDLPVESLTTSYQIHSAKALIADAPWDFDRPEGDAVVSAAPGVLCGVLAADCAPILLADPKRRVVAAAHAGWKGALGGIVGATVEAMVVQGAKLNNLVAVVGPCISQASYEVGLEFEARFVAEDPANSAFFRTGETGDKRQFDLPGFVLSQLRCAGVGTCTWIGTDTCENEQRFYSNRRAFRRGEPDFGRLLSAITLV